MTIAIGDEIMVIVRDRIGRVVARTRVVTIEHDRIWYGNQRDQWVRLDEEGITWCRGHGDWSTLLAANALVRSAT